MWQIKDKWSNTIELTEERWKHIIDGHWELQDHLNDVLETVRSGNGKQDALDQDKYKYYKAFDNLPFNYTYIVVVVKIIRNNFIITAYPIQKIRS